MLTSAQAVASRLDAQLGSLPHVVRTISAFLDNAQKWTLESATDAGSVTLLERLRVREWVGACKDFREARFLRAVRHAAVKGHLDVLNWWRTTYLPTAWSDETRIAVIRIAAVHGHLNILEFFLQDERNLQTIVTMGESDRPLICLHPEIVRWIGDRSRRAKLAILLDKPIKEADLEFLKWVNRQDKRYRTAFSQEAINTAIEAGRLDVLQWLTKHEEEWFSTQAMDCAAKNGHLEIMKWLEETDSEHCSYLGPYAFPGPDVVRNGHLDVIKWIVEESEILFESDFEHSSWVLKMTMTAIDAAQWLVLKYLDAYCPIDSKTQGIDKAIARGDLEMVKWLYAHGFKFTNDATRNAAEHGHLHILQWLYNNIPLMGGSTAIMDSAAVHNHLVIVKWLHENKYGGCTGTALGTAARKGYLEMVQWLIANRSEFGVANGAKPNDDEPTSTVIVAITNAMFSAASRGHLEIVQFLDRYQREPFARFGMDVVAANGHLEILKWLHSNRSEGCTTDAMDQAASKGHIDVVQWLHEHRTEGCTVDAMNGAAGKGHIEIVQWLLENRSEGFSAKGVHEAAINGHGDVLALLLLARPEVSFTSPVAKRAACSGHFQVIEILEKFDSKIVERAAAQMLEHNRNYLVDAYPEMGKLSGGSCELASVKDDKYNYEYDDDDF